MIVDADTPLDRRVWCVRVHNWFVREGVDA